MNETRHGEVFRNPACPYREAFIDAFTEGVIEACNRPAFIERALREALDRLRTPDLIDWFNRPATVH